MVSHKPIVAHLTAPACRGAHRFRGWTGRAAALILLGAFLVSTQGRGDSPAELTTAQGDKPVFRLADTTGAEAALSAFAGHTVVVHFFATWCEPCREELPALNRLAERGRDKNLAVIAISVAEVPIRVRRFVEAMPVSFPILLDQDRAVAKAWDVSGLPTTFILDSDLKPRLAVEREYDWDRLDVATLVKTLTPEKRP